MLDAVWGSWFQTGGQNGFLVEWQSRQCFVVVCALFRVRTATASSGHAANQMQLEQTIWGQMQGTSFFFLRHPVTCHFGADWTQGRDGKKRSSRKDGNAFGPMILFLAAESTAMMLQKWTLECMETWQLCKMNPVHPSARVPGANFGGGRRSPTERRRRGGQEIGWSTRPGGLCSLCRMSAGTGLASWPLHRQARGASWSFSIPFPASGSTRAPESPFHGER